MAGIYVHIPYCKQACTYCDFHFSTNRKPLDQMVECIRREIGLQRLFGRGRKIQTVYFGGGTPSIVPVGYLHAIVREIMETFEVDGNAEITLEANPDDIGEQGLDEWLHIGFNRLSLGVQTFDDAELNWMNRSHTAAEAEKSLQLIAGSGFNNFSVDLIFGSHLQSREQLQKNIDTVLSHNTPHLSCYALTPESKTAYMHQINRHLVPNINAEKQAEAFGIVRSRLEKANFEQYEISNFARPGMRSRHNSNYWKGVPYLGIGPGAHSFDGAKKRSRNVANNALYIQQIKNGDIPCEVEILTDTQLFNEYIMTSIRTMEGIDRELVKERFGDFFLEGLDSEAAKKIETGNLVADQGSIRLTEKGKLFADGIAVDLFRSGT